MLKKPKKTTKHPLSASFARRLISPFDSGWPSSPSTGAGAVVSTGAVVAGDCSEAMMEMLCVVYSTNCRWYSSQGPAHTSLSYTSYQSMTRVITTITRITCHSLLLCMLFPPGSPIRDKRQSLSLDPHDDLPKHSYYITCHCSTHTIPSYITRGKAPTCFNDARQVVDVVWCSSAHYTR
jgi:hypothetical protein